MTRLHICNTFFEKELQTPSTRSLSQWIRSHPIVLQLQFLPLLYALPTDRILVTSLPPNPDPRLCHIDNPPPSAQIIHWGPSPAISAYCRQHDLPYTIPSPELIRTINSKVYSFTHSPKLPHAALLHTQEEILHWIATTPGPKVLKSPFGTAGNGHIHNPDVKRLYKAPLIGEPWVQRIQDFSTQWDNGALLGVTLFENEPDGTYKATHTGTPEPWALEQHLAIAKPLIARIQSLGYSGNIGIDAFTYLWEGKQHLHPIVEINGRKTMSWVALQMPSKRLTYTSAAQGLLPSHLGSTHFPRNIH